MKKQTWLALAIALVSRGIVRLWHVPNARGNFEDNFLKNAKGRLYFFGLVPRFNFFRVQVCPRSRSLVHVGNLC
jgi:hypothetical protein